MYSLRVALWNANGLAQHCQEVKTFIQLQKLDVLLISETHFTNVSFLKIPGYTVYSANVPDGRAHGGSAVIIRSTINHCEFMKCETEQIQSISVKVIDWYGPLVISSAYCPPRYRLKNEDFQRFFGALGPRFVAGADYNAKHRHWGSRLTSPRGRELYKTIEELQLSCISTNAPTYWPADVNRLPDVLDFFVTKGISTRFTAISPSLDLSSDHSPIILSISTAVIEKPLPLQLSNNHTDWAYFRTKVEESISFRVLLKSEEDIDSAVNQFTTIVQDAAWHATPEAKRKNIDYHLPLNVRLAIIEKRRLRRIWQHSRHPDDKRNLNNAAQNLKRILYRLKNDALNDYLENLSPSGTAEYSLWKATSRGKRSHQPIPAFRKFDGGWARSDKEKAEVIAAHLLQVFKPFPSTDPIHEEKVMEFLESPYQMALPINTVRRQEISSLIKGLHENKSPGYDLITGKILKELPDKAVRLLTIIFNAILRVGYFPDQWKVAQVITVQKPGKPPNDVTSYRPISLLPILSKLLEKVILKRLRPFIEGNNVIPDFQFGFRTGHSTIEQVHRIVSKINSAFEEKKYCSVAFLDISQAFDKVWHPGLLFKIKKIFPHPLFVIVKSFLENRYFMVKFQTEQTLMFPIKAGVPQGSVLAPILYTLYTSDLPVTDKTTLATFADDTAIHASHENPAVASQLLQEHLDKLQEWQNKWRMKTNETKSSHVTFTLRRETCTPVFFNNKQIPQTDSSKYLGIHLDRRLTWRSHIWMKRKQLNVKFRQLYWLLGRTSPLTLRNKILIYKVILKPVWTYGIQLWGTSSDSNIEILQRFQSKMLRTITSAPWYITNRTLHNDMNLLTVKEEINNTATKYQTRLETHTNYLAINLLDNSETIRRLKRLHPTDLF